MRFSVIKIALVAVIMLLIISGTAWTDETAKKNIKNINVFGLMKTHWEYNQAVSGDNENVFKLHNCRIGVKGSLNDYTRFKAMFDFARTMNTDKFSGDMLLDGYIELSPNPWLKVIIGQFKTNYSTANLRSGSKLRFIDNPIVKTAPPVRDLGMMAESNYDKFSMSVGFYNGNGMNEQETNTNKNMSLRGVWKPIKSTNFSANYYTGKSDDVGSLASNLTRYNFGMGFSQNNISIEGEYSSYDNSTQIASGYFADAQYNIKTNGFISSVVPGFRYGWYDADTDTDNNAKTRYTAGLNVHFAKFTGAMIRLNYQINDSEAGDLDDVLKTEFQLAF